MCNLLTRHGQGFQVNFKSTSTAPYDECGKISLYWPYLIIWTIWFELFQCDHVHTCINRCLSKTNLEQDQVRQVIQSNRQSIIGRFDFKINIFSRKFFYELSISKYWSTGKNSSLRLGQNFRSFTKIGFQIELGLIWTELANTDMSSCMGSRCPSLSRHGLGRSAWIWIWNSSHYFYRHQKDR